MKNDINENKLETIFNIPDIADNLKTLGKLKDEVERQQKKKFIFSNKLYLLNVIDSLTDRLIEMHKMILVNSGRQK